MTESKRILIIAGADGAGKTTFSAEFLPGEARCSIFVNADLTAAGLDPFQPGRAAVRAGRVILSEIHRHVKNGDTFAFETTLSGLNYTRRIPCWREQGYRVSLFFATADAGGSHTAGRFACCARRA